jgi:hypothetical protein
LSQQEAEYSQQFGVRANPAGELLNAATGYPLAGTTNSGEPAAAACAKNPISPRTEIQAVHRIGTLLLTAGERALADLAGSRFA